MLSELQGPPLDEYEKRNELGAGASGNVFLYRRKKEESGNPGEGEYPEEIAVKQGFVGDNNGYEFVRELKLLMGMSHENIVRVLGAEAMHDVLYVKMELARTDLSKLKTLISKDRSVLPYGLN
jgi:serine/threonine protein kinase